ELLETAMRIQQRIEIIEPNDESNRDPAIRHVVNKSTTEFFIAERPSHGMDHTSTGLFFFGNVPDFFHSDRVHLRISIFVEIESHDELLCQRAARTFGKNGDPGANVDTGFEVALLVALLVDAFIAGSNTRYLAVFDEEFRTGKTCENINAAALDLLAEPTS